MSDFFNRFDDLDIEEDFFSRFKSTPTGAVSTSEKFRHADEDKLKRHAGTGGLGAIIEGGLRAAQGQEVPAELAAAAGDRGERIDLREETDLESDIDADAFTPTTAKVEGFLDTLGEAGTRFSEGARRGLTSIEERRGQFFGVGPELRDAAPQREVEDKRLVSQADTGLKHVIDFAGEVAPEVVASIGVNAVTGATGAVASALEGAGTNGFRNWAARRAADVALGTAENFASASVPIEHTPQVAAGTFALSSALSAIPGGSKLARRLIQGSDDVQTPLVRTLAELSQELSDSNLSRSFDDAAQQNRAIQESFAQSFHEAPPFPSSVSLRPAAGILEAFSERGAANFDLAGAQRTAIQDLSDLAEAKLIPFEVGPNGRFVVDGIEAATIREAADIIDNPRLRSNHHISQSIGSFYGDEAADVVARVDARLQAAGPKADIDFRTVVAAAKDAEHVTNIVRQIDDLGDEGMANMVAPDPVVGGIAALGFLRQASAAADEFAGNLTSKELDLFNNQKNSNLFTEIYINGSLQNMSTHAVNFLSNTAQLGLRPAVVGVEGLIGQASKAMQRFGLTADDAVTSKRVTDVGPVLDGYVRGVGSWIKALDTVGRNVQEAGNFYRLPEHQAKALRAGIDIDNQSFAQHVWNTLRGGWMLTNDGGDAVAKELNDNLARKFGQSVDLGSIATDAKLGLGGGGTFSGKGAERGLFGRGRRALRTPTNALQGMDSLFKSMNFTGERAAMTKRAAANAGMSVQDFISAGKNAEDGGVMAAKVQEINDKAAQLAKINTFTNDLGNFSKGLKVLRDTADLPLHFGNGYKVGGQVYRPSIPIGMVYQPFLQTPINITKNFLAHTPGGAALGVSRAAVQGVNEQTVKELAQGIVGTGLMIGAYSLVDEGKLDVRSQPTQGADARTQEAASGGQYIGSDFVMADGSRIPLNRFGPPGLLIAAAADIHRKVMMQAEKELEEGEALFERGGISEERIREIRAAATDKGIMEVLMSKDGAAIASQASFSAFANNVWNETSIADAIELMTELGRVSENPDRLEALLDDAEQKMAQAVQPFGAVNTLAKAEQEGEIRVPTDESSFAEGFKTRLAQRVPFLEPSPGASVGLVDVAGQERKSRFPGDQSDSLATRFLGASLGPMAPLVGLQTPALVGDETRDRGTRLAQEMQDLGVNKNFPTVSRELDKKLAIPSQVEQQIQMYRGQMRVQYVLPRLDNKAYQSAADEQKANALKKWLEQADRLSAKRARLALQRQAGKKEALDLTEFFGDDFDIPPITEFTKPEPEKDFLLRRQ